MSVNESLARNRYHPAASSHIALLDVDEQQQALLEKICPAGLFQRDASHRLAFNYHGCLECGCCRLIVGDSALREWRYPPSGCGITLRFG
ncbi:hypothetical protein [Entomohabitans teleogrylli]|uniref:hypothetical protein n=1 Tax=Entomohabitans teleogrylli TaxID=1384589 RepID=UPI00073D3A55|nr:hypothetical protein [Entomohabitans teleogrylli]